MGVCVKTFKLFFVLAICLALKASLVLAEEAAPVPPAPEVSAPAPKTESAPVTATVTAPVTAPALAVPPTKTTVTVTESPVVATANGVRVETRTVEAKPETHSTHPANKHFEGSSETKIENNITIDGRGLAYGAIPAAAPALVAAVTNEAFVSKPLSLTPVVGVTGFQGGLYNQVRNRGTVGLILDIPLVSVLSLEAEAQYGRFSLNTNGYGRGFGQYTGGANAKITLGKGLLQPYLGVGMMALYYEGLSANPYGQENRVMGAGQLVAGLDLNLFGGIAIGARGELLRPMTNLPPLYNMAYDNSYGNQSGENTRGADTATMSSNFFRVLGTVRVNF